MIIPDDSPSTPPKSRSMANLPPTEDAQAPPAYAPSQPPTPSTSTPISYRTFPESQRRSSYSYSQDPATKRFLSAFIVAIGIWLLAGLFTGSIVISVRSTEFMQFSLEQMGLVLNTGPIFPIPNHLELVHCLQGQQWMEAPSVQDVFVDMNNSYPYYAHHSYDLPLSADLMFLLSRGSLAHGNVRILTSPVVTDAVRIDIVVQHRSLGVLNDTMVCYVKQSDNEHGVGFFTPEYRFGHPDQPYFTVTVIIPERVESPHEIRALSTDMPHFGHQLKELDGHVYFSSLDLRGTNRPIEGESVAFGNGSFKTTNGFITIQELSSTKAEIVTTNAPITGRYSSSGDLKLHTTNGNVHVDVEFGTSLSDSGAKLDIATTNNKLDALIHAVNPLSNIRTRTTNGPLSLNVQDIPIDATLSLDGHTTNNYAEVTLSAAFQGSFTLSTTHFSPKIGVDEEVEDPSGRGRSRHVHSGPAVRGLLRGAVSWDDGVSRKSSNVNIHTTNAPITMWL